MPLADDIERTVEKKIQPAFIETVGIQQVNIIAMGATVKIMKDENYVQKWGTEFLNKEHFLIAINISVTRYVEADT